MKIRRERKQFSVVQKIAAIIVTLIAAVCLLQINILNTYSEPVEYTLEDKNIDLNLCAPLSDTLISFTPEQNHVNNVRFALSQIPSDGTGVVEVTLSHGDALLYRGLRACSNITVGEWVDFKINLTLDKAETYELHIRITDTELPEETQLCCYSEKENTAVPLVSFGYSNNLRLRDKALSSLFVILVSAGAFYLIRKAAEIRSAVCKITAKLFSSNLKSPRLPSIAVFAVTYLVIEFSQVAVDITLKVMISLLVFLATYWLENHWELVCRKMKDKKNAAALLLLSAWTAFSLIGSRCFIYPINRNLTIGAVFLFMITIALMFPIVAFVTIRTDEFYVRHIKKEEKIPWDFVGVTLIVILISALYFMRAFNPAISSPDTQHCMYYALNSIHGIDDWHPAFYILWLKAIIRIIPKAQAVVAVQYIFFAYVLLRGFLFLYEKGMPKGFLYGAMILTVLNCGNTVHITTIWKDIPYTLSVTWLTIIVAILLFGERKRRAYIYIELAVSLVWTCFFRQAGIVPFIVVGAALVFVFRKNWKIWASVMAAVCMVLIIKFPVYDYYEIQKDHGGGVYIGLGQDIMGAYYNGGELSEEAMAMVEVLSKTDIAGYGYSPYWARSSYDLSVSKGEFIKAYLDTLIRNPVMMLRSMICRMDAVWDIFMGENGSLGCVAYTSTMDTEKENWVDLWGKRETNFITERVQEWVTYSVNKPILNVIEWRSGIWFLMFMLAIGICAYKKQFKQSFLLFVPCLSHVLSLMLSTGWSDFRYFWPINLMTLFVYCTVMTLKPEESVK